MEFAVHCEQMSRLLEAERDEERARLADARARLTLAEREARGLAIADVEAVEEGSLAGRALVSYERRGKPIEGARIGTGALVTVRLRKEPRPDEPSGVVARRSRSRVAVAFDEPPPDWAVDGRVVLELEPSPVTWERLSAGLRRMAGEEGRRWRPLLTGAAPRFEARPRGPELPCALNPEQRAALDLADRALDLALVHGPPGTGKTTVLVEVIRRAVARGERVLACAPSNLAVDNLLERLLAAGLDGVRVGHPARVLESLLDHTLEARTAAHERSRIAAGLVAEALALRRSASRRKQRRGPGRFSEARVAEREARALLAEARALEARAQAEVLDRAPVVLATLTGLAGAGAGGAALPPRRGRRGHPGGGAGGVAGAAARRPGGAGRRPPAAAAHRPLGGGAGGRARDLALRAAGGAPRRRREGDAHRAAPHERGHHALPLRGALRRGAAGPPGGGPPRPRRRPARGDRHQRPRLRGGHAGGLRQPRERGRGPALRRRGGAGAGAGRGARRRGGDLPLRRAGAAAAGAAGGAGRAGAGGRHRGRLPGAREGGGGGEPDARQRRPARWASWPTSGA